MNRDLRDFQMFFVRSLHEYIQVVYFALGSFEICAGKVYIFTDF